MEFSSRRVGVQIPDVSDHSARDAKREIILRDARRIFSRKGYSGTTIVDITQSAAVSTATIYALFGDKAGLLQAVADDAAVQFIRLRRQIRTTGHSPRDRLTRFAVSYASLLADPLMRSMIRLLTADRDRFPEAALAVFDRGKAGIARTLIACLQGLGKRGRLRIEHPPRAAGQLMGMIEHPLFLMPLVTGDDVMPARTIDQIATDAVETFLARYAA